MIADLLLSLLGAGALAAALALLCYRSLGPGAALVAGIAAIGLAALVALRSEGRLVLSAGAAALAVALPSVFRAPLHATSAALAAALLAFWADPIVGIAALAALVWALPADPASWWGWGGAALLVVALPTSWGLPALSARLVLLTLAVAIALAGRRAVRTASAGPAAERATLAAIAALPALALVALLPLYGRVIELAADGLWAALGIAAVAVAGAAALGIVLLGLLAVASTVNDIKTSMAGWLAAGAMAIPLLGPRAVLVMLPLVAVGASLGGVLLLARIAKRRA